MSSKRTGSRIDRTKREIRLGETPVAVTPTEFRLLDTLARAAGRTFTRQELVERALGEEYDGLDRTVDVHVMNLRRKLGDAGKADRRPCSASATSSRDDRPLAPLASRPARWC